MGAPSVNPKFKDFVCFDNVNNLPWGRTYDINGDGLFGVDDIKALLPRPADLEIDGEEDSLNTACTQAKLVFVDKEVQWKLKGLLAKSPGPIRFPSLFGETDQLKAWALARIKDLDAGKGLAMTDKVRSAIVEMDLRARSILSGSADDEPFSVGLNFVPVFVSRDNWNLRITDVHPDSSAVAAGVLPGDILLAIDGRPIREFSTDANRTPGGLVDPETQMVRGFGGSRGSEMKVSLLRGDRRFDVALKRNLWSGRHLGTPENGLPWDGTEHVKPPIFPKGERLQERLLREEPPLGGCSCSLGARP